MQFWLSIDTDLTVHRHGIETPKGTKLHKRQGDLLVVKVPGHKYWIALYSDPKYAPAQYEVYRVIETGASAHNVKVERLIDFPVR